METLKTSVLRDVAPTARGPWRLVETLVGGASTAILPATDPRDIETAGAANIANAADIAEIAEIAHAADIADIADTAGGRRRRRPRDRSFAAFLRSFPPNGPLRPWSCTLGPHRERHVHPLLLRFWAELGLGCFGDGRGGLHFVDPADHDHQLARCLRRQQPDPAFVPFARTAGGDLFYWRDLRDHTAEPRLPETWDLAGDISVFRIHRDAAQRVSLSPRAFFATDLAAYIRAGLG